MKVALIGLAPSRDAIPWDSDWELWGLAWDGEALRMNRAFEMHDDWAENAPFDGYRERLEMMPVLYMQDAYLPNATRYPVEAIDNCGGYLESSVAYMLALAIHEGAEDIAILGVDMAADEEYGYQKPNTEYLVGLARGKGIKVHIPDSSPLCKPSGEFGYLQRYGKRK